MDAKEFVAINQNAHVKNYFDMLTVMSPPKISKRQEFGQENYNITERRRVKNVNEFTKQLKQQKLFIVPEGQI